MPMLYANPKDRFSCVKTQIYMYTNLISTMIQKEHTGVISGEMNSNPLSNVTWHGVILGNVNPWPSQNAEKVMHIKGRLLYQAIVLNNYVPFQNGNFS